MLWDASGAHPRLLKLVDVVRQHGDTVIIGGLDETFNFVGKLSSLRITK